MHVFPQSHVCPLAVERNSRRCLNPAGKPDRECISCRAELIGELGDAMQKGDASFFEMLFIDHVLKQEGFIGVPDEEGSIQLERARSDLKECSGDCAIGAISSALGGGSRLFITIDDDHEISEVYETLEEAISSYFSYKDYIDELVSSDCSKE